MKRLMVLLIPIILLAGCAVPQVTIQGLTVLRQQADVNQESLIKMIDSKVASEKAYIESIWKAVDDDTAALPADKLTAQWIKETVAVARAEADKAAEDVLKYEALKAKIIADKATRDALLDRMGNLIVKSQQWSSQTESLVTELMNMLKQGG